MARTAKESINETTEVIDQDNEQQHEKGKLWLILPLLILGALAFASFTILRRNAQSDED